MADVLSPLTGTVARVELAVGATVEPGTPVVIVESMKMEYAIDAGADGTLSEVRVAVGDAVQAGDVLAVVAEAPAEAPAARADGDTQVAASADGPGPAAPDRPTAGTRADLAEVADRHARGLDAARDEVVARRHARGHRTARENVADLLDEGSFVEYGPLVVAAQRRRRPLDDLIARTPADGLVAGVGTVDGRPTAVLSYDYTVLAGTQGYRNHHKKDRLFDVIERLRLPVVFFAEGGGGRPGDTDAPGVSGLDTLAFHLWGGLSGLVPRVGIANGRCFAGNAAILGSSDVVIATRGANIGMGGPAMIEGGGLGVFAPEDVGPVEVQVANGVVDVLVDDEAEAVAVARRYLAYFADPGPSPAPSPSTPPTWAVADQAALRDLVPENRRRVYDVRAVITGLADTGSVLELRAGFAPGMITALAEVEGRPLGIVANNPAHLAGAIDADGADKAARFLQLCDAFDVPLLFLCDTPGIMVGPEAEETGLVRHASRLFVVGASLTVPFGTIILRKGYGLGAQAMAGGSFKAPLFCVAWPTGEVGGMGLEGAVRLGYRKELAAIDDPTEREAAFQGMVDAAYEHGKALNSASHFEIDDVIDPADSRRWITSMLTSAPRPPRGAGKKRPVVDTW